MDPDCHDQYSVIYDGGETTAIFKNTPSEGVLVEARKVSLVRFNFSLPQTTDLTDYLTVLGDAVHCDASKF